MNPLFSPRWLGVFYAREAINLKSMFLALFVQPTT
uniref:Uncharacterized protein n=1 Tax=Anguilla anguilla TaxID=7936 RepID=A0A0E9SBE9_ANGAN